MAPFLLAYCVGRSNLMEVTQMDQVSFWLDAAGKYELLTDEQLFDLCKQRDAHEEGSKGYADAINKITLGNLRLVVRQAKTMGRTNRAYSLVGANAADMLQHGYLGLRRAAEKFDVTRGYRFSTYASPWIRQGIQRWAFSTESTIYVPEGTVRELNYRRINGKPSNHAGAPKCDSVLLAGFRATNISSIDRVLRKEEDGTLVDLMGPDNRLNADDDAPSGKRCPSLVEAMAKACIPPRVQDLMNAYSKRGNMVVAAKKSGWPVKEAPVVIRETIAKLQELA